MSTHSVNVGTRSCLLLTDVVAKVGACEGAVLMFLGTSKPSPTSTHPEGTAALISRRRRSELSSQRRRRCDEFGEAPQVLGDGRECELVLCTGETNFGATSVAAPKAASLSVARYSFTAPLAC